MTDDEVYDPDGSFLDGQDEAPLGEAPEEDDWMERYRQSARYLEDWPHEDAETAHARDLEAAQAWVPVTSSTPAPDVNPFARHFEGIPKPPPGAVDAAFDQLIAERDRKERMRGIDEVAVQRLKSRVIRGTSIMEIPEPAPLIDGYLSLDSLAVLYGPPGSAKSLLALDWACSVATGSWWHRRKVTQGSVLYTVAEGASGMAKRFSAWRLHAQIYGDGLFDGIHWLVDAPNLYDRRAAGAFIEFAYDIEPAFIIIDTFARCIVGADENSAKDVGVVVGHLERLREATGASVLVVHHTPKSGEGIRGHSALEGAVDTGIAIKQVDGVVTVTPTKQKNSGLLADRRLSIVGEADSVVLVPAITTRDIALDDLPVSHRRMLEELHAVDLGLGVPHGQWKEASSIPKSSFSRYLKQLLEVGTVADVKTSGKTPRYALTNVGCGVIGVPVRATTLLDQQEEATA